MNDPRGHRFLPYHPDAYDEHFALRIPLTLWAVLLYALHAECLLLLGHLPQAGAELGYLLAYVAPAELVASLAADMLQPGLHGPSFDWHTDAETNAQGGVSAGGGGWKVSWVPPGFEFKERSLQRMGAREAPIDHLVYSDGVAMVSIFVEAVADVTRALRGRSSRGAVNAFSRLADSHQITVVGEVPPATAQKIAKSVVRAEP